MKLNPEELVVSSFPTAEPAGDTGGTTNDPTPMTHCYWCPAGTTDPFTVPIDA